jgi:hypothetical protein
VARPGTITEVDGGVVASVTTSDRAGRPTNMSEVAVDPRHLTAKVRAETGSEEIATASGLPTWIPLAIVACSNSE